jgi:hypothetical protein
MDDRLQRRLMDADPLTVPGGYQADAARLDAIREQIMQSGQHTLRAAIRPRAIGGVALVAASLAIVLAVVSLARPTATTLAWERVPTQVTDAQKAAAEQACNAGLPGINGPGTPADGTSSVAVGGGPVTSTSDSGPEQGGGRTGTILGGPVPPPMPTNLPPLVSLELHGNGGIAILADDETTAYCLLVAKGDGFQMGGLLIPTANGGTMGVVGIGKPAEGAGGPTSGQASGQASGSGQLVGGGPATAGGQSVGAVGNGPDGFQVTAMGMTFDGTSLGLIAGASPEGATSVTVAGGPADGGTATVTKGLFALWSPGALGSATVTVTALDASGQEIAHQTLFGQVPDGGGYVVNGTHQP